MLAAGCGAGAADAGSGDAGPPPGLPPVVFLTVNEVPRAMNGSAPFTALDGTLTAFTLALPLDGFTLDVTADPGDAPVDESTLRVACDAPLGGGAGQGGRDAGDDLADLFAAALPGVWSWRVPADLSFEPTAPGAAVTCAAGVRDADGRPAAESALAFAAVAATAQLDPFDVPDVWVLDFTRDLFVVSPAADPLTGAYTVISVDGANGVPDYLEDMAVIGFQGGETAPGAATLVAGGDVGVNAVAARRVREALLARVRGFYRQDATGGGGPDAVAATFILDDDPAAPDPATFAPDGGFSMIAVGGEGTAADRLVPYFGKAELDPRNEVRNDDTPFGLGVFTTTALRAVLAIDFAAVALGPFVPALGGTALGDDPRDPIFLADGFDPTDPAADPAVVDRADRFELVLGVLIKALGALTAHEIGHSLGLVADGPPPTGLFGGEALAEFAYPLTTPAHLDVAGLNLMASGGGGAGLASGAASLFEEPFFTPLELAYLRGRLWVLPAQ
jgi:hypothetical protein